MNSMRSRVLLRALASESERLQFWQDSSGIEMTHAQAKGLPAWLRSYPTIMEAVGEITDLTSKTPVGVMVNRLAPGVEVPKHQDTEGGERYHLPIVTNPHAMWWDAEGGELHMTPGSWWGPVPYSIPHRVTNHGGTARVHLVVDVDG